MRTSPIPPQGGSANASIGRVPPWRSFVAIGDSFTEGMCDAEPGARDRYVGWADRLATELSARRQEAGQPALQYANLAVRGTLLRPIVTEQLEAALALNPDLISIVGGGNDLLRPDASINALVLRLEWAVAVARRSGADVLLANSTDPSESPVISLTRGRSATYYTWLWSIARRHGAFVLDLWGMRSLRDWRMWAPDRIHLSSEGHRRVAEGALVALGLAPSDPEWDTPLPPTRPLTALEQARWNGEWAWHHALPWATRRLRRRSSSTGRRAKDEAYRSV